MRARSRFLRGDRQTRWQDGHARGRLGKTGRQIMCHRAGRKVSARVRAGQTSDLHCRRLRRDTFQRFCAGGNPLSNWKPRSRFFTACARPTTSSSMRNSGNWSSRIPTSTFFVTCTRLHLQDPWTGRRGRIDAEWVREHIYDLANTIFTPAALMNSWKRPSAWSCSTSKYPRNKLKRKSGDRSATGTF